MKKLLISGLLLANLALFNPVSAQIHFGVNTAVNSTFVLDKGLSEDPRYNATMTYNFAPLGFTFGVDLGPGFGLQLESIWAKQGQLYEVLDFAKKAVGERKIDVNYFHLPLMLKFMNAGDKQFRPNFSFGPQLSILRNGLETLEYAQSIQSFPEATTEFINNMDGTYTIIDQLNGITIEGATLNNDGTYNIPALEATELLNSEAQSQIEQFKNAELQIAASFGLDIDLSKDLYLSSVIRANYSFTDMRNKDLIDALKSSSTAQDLFNRRANLAVGIQLGLHYIVGGTRFFK